MLPLFSLASCSQSTESVEERFALVLRESSSPAVWKDGRGSNPRLDQAIKRFQALGESTIPFLREELMGPSTDRSYWAAHLLTAFRVPAACKALLDGAKHAQANTTRVRCLIGLGELQCKTAEEYLHDVSTRSSVAFRSLAQINAKVARALAENELELEIAEASERNAHRVLVAAEVLESVGNRGSVSVLESAQVEVEEVLSSSSTSRSDLKGVRTAIQRAINRIKRRL